MGLPSQKKLELLNYGEYLQEMLPKFIQQSQVCLSVHTQIWLLELDERSGELSGYLLLKVIEKFLILLNSESPWY